MHTLWLPPHEFSATSSSGTLCTLFNRQAKISYQLDDAQFLLSVALQSIPLILPLKQAPEVLSSLSEIEITLIDNHHIANLHRDFLNDDSPTDIITFDHGELLISAETAFYQGQRYQKHYIQETALYIIHGLLHLAGYKDASPDEARTMAQLQERLLTQINS